MKFSTLLKKNIKDPEDLKKYFCIPDKNIRYIRGITHLHPMEISQYYMSIIDDLDESDPLKKMVVPAMEERNIAGSYDTSGELKSTKLQGVQHKYPQTVLILATNKCATYCRYCFRKRLIGLSNEETLDRLDDAVKYIAAHREVDNVLISGGDPVILPTSMIARYLKKFSSIDHVKFIRFGTKIPVVLPQRIIYDEKLLSLLREYSSSTKRIYFITQYNHPKEITNTSVAAIDKLINAGVILKNQTVLLKGVNDDPFIMTDLQNRLTAIGISPYYVFQYRPVKRAKKKFQVPLLTGCNIIEHSKCLMSGPSKKFKYVMSHKSGKIEIIGKQDNSIILKYHQARNKKQIGNIFRKKLNPHACWLEDLEQIE